ncbi:MAG TPA: phosphatidate cytidylyltransferase [Planctomycetota bacterium]|nr:phosphatidate cytidylyltransferase [Planctomycetota bacterium]
MTELVAMLAHPTPLVLMGEIVLGCLLFATVLVWSVAAAKPQVKLSEVKLKIKAWWLMGAIFFGAIAISGKMSYLMIALLCYLALKEYFTLQPTQTADRGALFWAYMAIPVQFIWITMPWWDMFLLFIPVYVFLLLAVRQILTGVTQDFIARTGRIFFGVMLFVYCLSHLAYLLSKDIEFPDGPPFGRQMVLFLVFLTEANDVCAFTFGKLFGKHKMAPSVSPNKTWEGFIGGITCVTLGGGLLHFLTPFHMVPAMALGLLIGVTGVFGDLCTSAIKRDMGVKDASQFIPGHGGVMDRVNSLTFSTPVFFHVVNFFAYSYNDPARPFPKTLHKFLETYLPWTVS